KSIAEETRNQRAEEARRPIQKARSLEELFKQRDAGEIPELNVIIRADVDGSVDAIRYALGQLPRDQVTMALRHTGVGAVIDSDVLLADASDAIVIAFRVAPGAKTRRLAETHGVDIREYKVIYDLIDDVTKALEGLLTPEEHLETRGTAEVREVFKISKVGSVAGCYLTDGVIARDHRIRLIREGVIIREDCRIDSLKRFKDDVKEVRSGMECGIRLERFDDIKQGDLLEAYEIVHVARTL
ncbi:MAG: translation initiation factor IF-2, partial [Planctomycetes bacterium]|nr:translation initiation factor IF-2 [Planctomycetota bacterium]